MRPARNPPELRLRCASQVIQGAAGSTTWGGMAVDRVMSESKEIARLQRGESLVFESDGPVPDEAYVSVYHRADLANSARTRIAEAPISPQEMAWTANFPPGQYILEVFLVWAKLGDADYFFTVEVV